MPTAKKQTAHDVRRQPAEPVKSAAKSSAAPKSHTAKTSAFDDLPKTAQTHFELFYLAATAHLIRQTTEIYGTRAAAFHEFPFLQTYDERLAGREPDNLADASALRWWQKNLILWEKNAAVHLPLLALREKSGLSFAAVLMFICAGLSEEDWRFAQIFVRVHELDGERRPSAGLLQNWFRDRDNPNQARADLRRLAELGLIQFANPEAARSEWIVKTNEILWNAARAENPKNPAENLPENLADWLRYSPRGSLPANEQIVASDQLKQQLKVLPGLLETNEIKTVIVRGAKHNGRKTIVGAVAREANLGLLEITNFDPKDLQRWRTIETLAIMLDALPVFRLEAAPGETVEFPASHSDTVFAVTMGKTGGVAGATIEKNTTLNVKMPVEAERRVHWETSFGLSKVRDLPAICERFRLSSGNLRRAAQIAKAHAALNEHQEITFADVQSAIGVLSREALDSLATWLEPLALDLDFLAVADETLCDLRELAKRCRVREKLTENTGVALRGRLEIGVRALFKGASGTGKTFAARLLAAELGMDLYRLDLSTVVNKYIGETEKNLAKIFNHVEELDVILLLDEGDALMTQRTNVGSANDRYANLETNYLLQRLESFEGIMIVTTNAVDRIDQAFERRMDAVVEFLPAGFAERLRIWSLHLPEINQVSNEFLIQVAERCELSGGQIRNAALHAHALALGDDCPISNQHLEIAVRREYRKFAALCPLRSDRKLIGNLDRW